MPGLSIGWSGSIGMIGYLKVNVVVVVVKTAVFLYEIGTVIVRSPKNVFPDLGENFLRKAKERTAFVPKLLHTGTSEHRHSCVVVMYFRFLPCREVVCFEVRELLKAPSRQVIIVDASEECFVVG